MAEKVHKGKPFTDEELGIWLAKTIHADEGSPWGYEREYPFIACDKGLICEVRGVGRKMDDKLLDYIGSLSPHRLKKLLVEVMDMRQRLAEKETPHS